MREENKLEKYNRRLNYGKDDEYIEDDEGVFLNPLMVFIYPIREHEVFFKGFVIFLNYGVAGILKGRNRQKHIQQVVLGVYYGADIFLIIENEAVGIAGEIY